jgi:hypothetical protein
MPEIFQEPDFNNNDGQICLAIGAASAWSYGPLIRV